MDLLTRLQKIAPKTIDVDAPELGDDCKLRFRELTGCEQLEFYNLLQEKKNSQVSALAYALKTCLIDADSLMGLTGIDENGKNEIQTVKEAEDVIRALPAKLFQRINKAIFELNNGESEKKS